MSKKTIFLLSFSMFLLCFSDAIYAAGSIRNANWIKSGNNMHISLGDISKKTITIGCAHKYTFEEPKFKRHGEYDTIHIAGLSLLGNRVGAPILPCKPVRLLIPHMQKVTGINIILGPAQEITGTYRIEYSQRPIPISYMGKVAPTVPDSEVYNSNDIYPSMPADDVSIQGKYGYKILILNLFPVEYYPLSGKVAYYNEMLIQVETIPLETAQLENILTPDPNAIEEMRLIIDNPEALNIYKTN